MGVIQISLSQWQANGNQHPEKPADRLPSHVIRCDLAASYRRLLDLSDLVWWGCSALRVKFKSLGKELLQMSRPVTINLYCCIGRQQFLHHLTAGAARHA